ncbi:MAG: hydroxymethylpyrimidine/phosphomethylpyrimidine kinase [Ghiorsea sp.]
MEERPVCLTVGGSDSCGGAGIQADLRVFESLEVHGCSAITALTAQNPKNISHIQPSSIEQFEAELKAIANFYDVACIKTGMLYDDNHLNTLISLHQTHLPKTKLIVDPVLIASSGKHLFICDDTVTAYKKLITSATLWTPNLQEAAFFLGHPVDDPVDAVSELLLMGKTAVLLKGGHGEGDVLRDILCEKDGTITFFEHTKQNIQTEQAHGTGCRLASAIAANLCHENSLHSSVYEAQHWLQTDLKY